MGSVLSFATGKMKFASKAGLFTCLSVGAPNRSWGAFLASLRAKGSSRQKQGVSPFPSSRRHRPAGTAAPRNRRICDATGRICRGAFVSTKAFRRPQRFAAPPIARDRPAGAAAPRNPRICDATGRILFEKDPPKLSPDEPVPSPKKHMVVYDDKCNFK